MDNQMINNTSMSKSPTFQRRRLTSNKYKAIDYQVVAFEVLAKRKDSTINPPASNRKPFKTTMSHSKISYAQTTD